MIPLDRYNVELSADIEVKQAAATQQMKELVERLSNAPKYHTLTKQDRYLLSKEAYAPDLVNNLVVMTQRDHSSSSSQHDHLAVGFNYAAFDPALYSDKAIIDAFKRASHGCCCYCESFLLPTGDGEVSHYRPVALLDQKDTGRGESTQTYSPYSELAYEQTNLVFICHECNRNKAGHFPVKDKRFPNVTIAQEKALLVDPYQESPRSHIRFNPYNGHAYPFDEVCAFYKEKHNKDASEVEKLIWQNPGAIPSQFTSSGKLITDDKTQQQYEDWRAHNQSDNPQFKGVHTIEVIGLNRSALVLARLATVSSIMDSDINNDDKSIKPVTTEEVTTLAYRSIAIDALETNQRNNTYSDKAKPKNKAGEYVETKSMSETTSLMAKEIPTMPVWLRSCLSYLVLESELTQSDRRRLVYLCSEDKVYGGTDTEKCVFLPIDWQQDFEQVIKVKSHRNIWEASFTELAQTRPHELITLFANNDVWVEGPFTPLA